MKKIPVMLFSLFLAGLGITGALQQAEMAVESIPAEREEAYLCTTADVLETTATTPAPMPTESYFELTATTPTSPFERPTETTKVDTSDEICTLQVHDDANGLIAETTNEPKTEAPEITPAPADTSAPVPRNSDPYHTDNYPNNIYSEELIYNSDGELIGKTYTIPTEFGSDTIWIDGHAFYNVPGFGLVEWGGPSQRTEDYTMYESGVKVGIMDGEDEAPASSTPTGHPTELPTPIEETIDQTINTGPERNSTPPDYKPELTPPVDPNARDIG